MVNVLTYEEIDRVFYEHIRREIVRIGFTVDVKQHNTGTSYETARNNLRASLLSQNEAFRLVDVLGVATWDDKDEKSDARIIILRTGEQPGNIGGSPVPFYIPTTTGQGITTFEKFRMPDMTTTLTYDVRVVTDQIIMERTLLKAVARAMGARGFKPTVDNQLDFTDDYVCVVKTNFSDLGNQRYMERSISYVVEDVFIEDAPLVAADIPRLTTIQYISLAGDTVGGTITVGPVTHASFPYQLPINL